MLSLLVNLTEYRGGGKNLGQSGFVPIGGRQLANPRGWGSHRAKGVRDGQGRSSKACARSPALLHPQVRLPGERARVGRAAPNSGLARDSAGATRERGTGAPEKTRGPETECAPPVGPLGAVPRLSPADVVCSVPTAPEFCGPPTPPPDRTVKQNGVVRKSARKIGDRSVTVRNGRGAGQQLHPGAGVAPSPSTPGDPGISSQAQGRPGGAQGVGHTGRCDPLSGKRPQGRNLCRPPPAPLKEAGVKKRGILTLPPRVAQNRGNRRNLSPQLLFPTCHTLSHPVPHFGTVMPSLEVA